MALSIFTDKTSAPVRDDLMKILGEALVYWDEIRDFVLKSYPGATETWNYSGKNYGWSYRLTGKKAVIIYMTPRPTFFLVGLVFGQKAVEAALNSEISEVTRNIITSATTYAEGRGFRLDVKDRETVNEVKALIGIKLAK